MKFKGFTTTSVNLLNEAYFDGYNVGGRLLEGVYFKAKIENRELVVSFADPNGNYEKGLKEYAEDSDEFECNGEFVYLECDE